jgi:hypothetical protein
VQAPVTPVSVAEPAVAPPVMCGTSSGGVGVTVGVAVLVAVAVAVGVSVGVLVGVSVAATGMHVVPDSVDPAGQVVQLFGPAKKQVAQLASQAAQVVFVMPPHGNCWYCPAAQTLQAAHTVSV